MHASPLAQTRKRKKTVILAPKRPLQLQNSIFLIQNLNFKPLLALLTSNITCMERVCGVWAKNSAKQRKTVILAVTAQNSKILIQNLNFRRFGAKISVFHCLALFFDVLWSVEASPSVHTRRRPTNFIFEAINATCNSNFELKNVNFEL